MTINKIYDQIPEKVCAGCSQRFDHECMAYQEPHSPAETLARRDGIALCDFRSFGARALARTLTPEDWKRAQKYIREIENTEGVSTWWYKFVDNSKPGKFDLERFLAVMRKVLEL